ncbi:MAG: recombinase family protein [Pseudomonadota bacterium]
MKAVPKAYSYVRFSTPEQHQGDSLRRQVEMARTYADEHGLELIEDDEFTFQDLGRSAFRGQNAEEGQLKRFRRMIEDGVIENGSYLLVENPDRLSRMPTDQAIGVLSEIVRSGVAVVTLSDRQVYTSKALDEDSFLIIRAVLQFSLGNQESQKKSERLKEAWKEKRRTGNEKPLTSVGPAWLRLDKETGEWEINEAKAKVVRKIFHLHELGSGQERIAKTLNTQGVKTFGRAKAGWQKSAVHRILVNPAVVGVCVPHRVDTRDDGGRKRKLRTPLDPIEGYYPPIIDLETWDSAQLRLKSAKPKGNTTEIVNPLARLARCPRCGGSMSRVEKGKRSKPFLVCSRAKRAAGCEYHSVKLEPILDALRNNVDYLAAEPPAANEALQSELEAVESQLETLEDQRTAILQALEGLPRAKRKPLITELSRIEGPRSELKEKVEELREARDQDLPKRYQVALEGLAKFFPDSSFSAGQLNAQLMQVVEKVVVDYDSEYLDIHWAWGGVSHVRYWGPKTSFKDETL